MSNKKPDVKDLAIWLKQCPFPFKEMNFHLDDDEIWIGLRYPEDNYMEVKEQIERDCEGRHERAMTIIAEDGEVIEHETIH